MIDILNAQNIPFMNSSGRGTFTNYDITDRVFTIHKKMVNVSTDDANLNYTTKEQIRFFYRIKDIKSVNSIKFSDTCLFLNGENALPRKEYEEYNFSYLILNDGILFTMFLEDVIGDIIIDYE